MPQRITISPDSLLMIMSLPLLIDDFRSLWPCEMVDALVITDGCHAQVVVNDFIVKYYRVLQVMGLSYRWWVSLWMKRPVLYMFIGLAGAFHNLSWTSSNISSDRLICTVWKLSFLAGTTTIWINIMDYYGIYSIHYRFWRLINISTEA